MLDQYDNLTNKDIARAVHRTQLEKAISHTRRLLESPKAAEDPELATIWSKKLERQEANFYGVCR